MATFPATCTRCESKYDVSAQSVKLAKSRAAHLERTGGICLDCKRAGAASAMAQEDMDSGYTSLKGTEQQIAWASKIRHQHIYVLEAVREMIHADDLDAAAERFESEGKSVSEIFDLLEDIGQYHKMDTPEKYQARRDEIMIDDLIEILKAEDRASYWIDVKINQVYSSEIGQLMSK